MVLAETMALLSIAKGGVGVIKRGKSVLDLPETYEAVKTKYKDWSGTSPIESFRSNPQAYNEILVLMLTNIFLKMSQKETDPAMKQEYADFSNTLKNIFMKEGYNQVTQAPAPAPAPAPVAAVKGAIPASMMGAAEGGGKRPKKRTKKRKKQTKKRKSRTRRV